MLEPHVEPARAPGRLVEGRPADDSSNLSAALFRIMSVDGEAPSDLVADMRLCLPGLEAIDAVPVGGPGKAGAITLRERGLRRPVELADASFGTGHFDLYQCQMWDRSTPIKVTVRTLDDFVRSGKVRYIGCPNFSAAQLIEAQWVAEQMGGAGFSSLQPRCSLLATEIESEILPMCRRLGLGALTCSPLASGVLACRYWRGAEPEAESRAYRWAATAAAPDVPVATRRAMQTTVDDMLDGRAFDVAEEVQRVADVSGATVAAVARAWVSQRPGITSVIVGPRTLDQLQINLAGFEPELPAETIDRIDRLTSPAVRPTNGLPAAAMAAASGL